VVQTFGIGAMINGMLPDVHICRRGVRTGGGDAGFLLASTISLVVVLFSKVLGGWIQFHRPPAARTPLTC
jgi:hypothetical protein